MRLNNSTQCQHYKVKVLLQLDNLHDKPDKDKHNNPLSYYCQVQYGILLKELKLDKWVFDGV